MTASRRCRARARRDVFVVRLGLLPEAGINRRKRPCRLAHFQRNAHPETVAHAEALS